MAYSGGVDSSLVAALLHRVHGTKALAVLGVSPSLPSEQRQLAHRVAEQIGIAVKEVATKESEEEQYVKNEGMACFSCKSALYSSLLAVFEGEARDGVVLYNGTNADDVHDPTRVGLLAAKNFQVVQPLQALGASKEQVRQVARELGLLNAHFAASPCLRSRLALGVRATPEALKRVEQAESLVKEALASARPCLHAPNVNLRVRHLRDGSARIELDANTLAQAQQQEVLAEMGGRIASLGFSSVGFAPFKSGSNSTK